MFGCGQLDTDETGDPHKTVDSNRMLWSSSTSRSAPTAMACGSVRSKCWAAIRNRATAAAPVSRCKRVLTRSHHAQQASANNANDEYLPNRFCDGRRHQICLGDLHGVPIRPRPPLLPLTRLHLAAAMPAQRRRCRGVTPAGPPPGRSSPSSGCRSADTSAPTGRRNVASTQATGIPSVDPRSVTSRNRDHDNTRTTGDDRERLDGVGDRRAGCLEPSVEHDVHRRQHLVVG